ncbi:MAG: hypothetical protein EOO45_03945 [Flavobacterium sp.]|nr:MAG: hypothetical protein EOO45_03945 [Flavobacterium sp.]
MTAILLFCSILIGFSISRLTVFDFIYLFIFAGLLLGLALLVGLIDVIQKTNNFSYFGLIFLFFAISVVSAMTFSKERVDNYRRTAEQMVKDLEKFKADTGRYPDYLDSASSLRLGTEIYYNTDTSGQSFHISYSLDGWHKEWYNSASKQWSGGD